MTTRQRLWRCLEWLAVILFVVMAAAVVIAAL